MHTHSRRDFFAQTLGAGFFASSLLEQSLLRAAQARAQSATARADAFDLEKVADGIWAAIAKPATVLHCNGVIFENANDVLIVDSHSGIAAVASLVAQIRREVTQKPIRYVVNTHMHGDHVQGNPAYRKIAPKADIISSAATRKAMTEVGPQRLKGYLDSMVKTIETNKAKLAAAKSPEEKAHWEHANEDLRAFMSEMKDLPFELPNVTFDRHMVIHDKAHELHLTFRGRGHTAGDIVVFCPEKKVIASGDLAHGFLPYIGDGYPRDWAGTLKSVGELEFTQVIGGHGDVQHSRDRFSQQTAYIEELVAAVDEGKRAGRSVEELQRALTPGTMKSLERDGYGEFVAATLARYFGGYPPKSAADSLADAVKENVATTYRVIDRA